MGIASGRTHDVVGARALGMPTALVVDEGAEPPSQLGEQPEAHHEIVSLAELIKICGA